MRHMRKESILLPAGTHRFAQRRRHLVHLLLIIHLLGRIDKGQNQTLKLFGLGDTFSILIHHHFMNGRAGLRHIRSNANQIRLSGYGSTVLLDRFHGSKYLLALLDQIDGGKVIGDIAKRTPHILLRHIKFGGNILGKFPDVQILIHHENTNQGCGQEVGHIVIHSGKLGNLGLVLRIHCIKLLVYRLKFLVGRLQLLIGGQQLFIGCLKLRVHGLQFRNRLAQIFLRYLQFLLQIGNTLGGG